MTELLGTICELTMAGRWGRANRQDVAIRDQFQANGREYLLVQSLTNALEGEYFLLTNRNDRDHIDQFEPRVLLMVAIGKNKEGFNFTTFTHSHATEKDFYYYGTGMLQIVDDELEALRKKGPESSGIFGPLQDWFGRMMGTRR